MTSVLGPSPARALRAHIRSPLRQCLTTPIHRRTFLSNPLSSNNNTTSSSPQTLSATRILPYRAKPIYELIADISAYPNFIPYCTSSLVTSSSQTEKQISGRTWPRTADLRVGFGPYDEVFRSKVYCAPYAVLEAVSGEARTTIPESQLSHYQEAPSTTAAQSSAPPETFSSDSSSPFTSLLTRWSFREFPYKPLPPDGQPPQQGQANARPSLPRTEVSLVIEVVFANAVYAALSQAAAPKVAGMMAEAFERRAREVLGEGERVVDEEKGEGRGIGRAG